MLKLIQFIYLSPGQELLKNSRKFDDNIIHSLNTTIPTQSFTDEKDATKTCKDLHGQVGRCLIFRWNTNWRI